MIKEAITVFNDGEYDKTCNEGSPTQSGHICIFWAVQKGTSQNMRYFPKACKIMMSWPNAGISGTQSMRQRRREDEGPPKA